MAPKPFGFLAHRALRELAIRDARGIADAQEEHRLEQLFAFDDFCAKQRARIAAGLKAQTERIAKARYGDCEGDGSHFVVMRRGTTEVSTPVHRRYQEQRG